MHGQVGNTANCMALASLIGLEYDIRTLVGQTHFNATDMEEGLLTKKVNKLGSILEFSDNGIDALERLARTNRLTPENVKNNAVVLEADRLDLLPGTTKLDEELYANMSDVIPAIFQSAKQFYDNVILDLHSGPNNSLTNALLNNSDLIVVSLSQNLNVLERFFAKENWPSALHDKPFIILLGQYDPHSKYTAANIKRHFEWKQPIYTIPYCTGYRDAINDKDVLGWFRRNRNINKRHMSYSFIQGVREVSEVILEAIGVNSNLKVIERGVS